MTDGSRPLSTDFFISLNASTNRSRVFFSANAPNLDIPAPTIATPRARDFDVGMKPPFDAVISFRWSSSLRRQPKAYRDHHVDGNFLLVRCLWSRYGLEKAPSPTRPAMDHRI